LALFAIIVCYELYLYYCFQISTVVFFFKIIITNIISVFLLWLLSLLFMLFIYYLWFCWFRSLFMRSHLRFNLIPIIFFDNLLMNQNKYIILHLNVSKTTIFLVYLYEIWSINKIFISSFDSVTITLLANCNILRFTRLFWITIPLILPCFSILTLNLD